MNAIIDLLTGSGIVPSIFILAMVIVVGILFSRIRVKGFSLGVTWVLFVGILAGHLGLHMDADVLTFVKEIGMVLFIFGIGMIVGPSFFATFRQGGVQLNLLSMLSIVLALLITYGIYCLSGLPIETLSGILSGAVTNTPSLGAAQEAVKGAVGSVSADIGIGYALAYPVAIVGLIVTTALLKWALRIDVDKELRVIEEREKASRMEAAVLSVEVTNPALFGKDVYHVKSLLEKHQVVISRILHHDTGMIEMASSDTIIQQGDKLLIIAEQNEEETICAFIGTKIEMDDSAWFKLDSKYVSRRCLVTRPEVAGKSIEQLRFRSLYHVNVSRVRRTGVHLIAKPNLRLQIGDTVILVGRDEDVRQVENVLGNSSNDLLKPNLLILFVVVMLGVLIGSIEVHMGGMPIPIKLGLSGGTLVAAILVSSFGTRFRLNTHNTHSVNMMLREMGITLFLACVGISVGGSFVEKLVGGGYVWMLYAAGMMIIPLWITCIIGRYVLRLDYFTLLGYIAGSLTFAPALSLTPDASMNNIASIRYATIYPLTMFIRVMAVQWLVLLLI